MVLRNPKYLRRDYEATNVVAARVTKNATDPRAIPAWEPASEEILKGLDFLYSQAGVEYYGFI